MDDTAALECYSSGCDAYFEPMVIICSMTMTARTHGSRNQRIEAGEVLIITHSNHFGCLYFYLQNFELCWTKGDQ